MGEISKFVSSDNGRIAAFSNMVQKISYESGIEQKIIQQYGEDAMYKWESMKKSPINSLLNLSVEHRQDELQHILGFFKEDVQNLITSEEKLEKSMRIASLGYEMILGL
jgi:hypothetical protein